MIFRFVTLGFSILHTKVSVCVLFVFSTCVFAPLKTSIYSRQIPDERRAMRGSNMGRTFSWGCRMLRYLHISGDKGQSPKRHFLLSPKFGLSQPVTQRIVCAPLSFPQKCLWMRLYAISACKSLWSTLSTFLYHFTSALP